MSKTNATALALRLAKTYDVDLSTLSGSGSGGTVTARDVLEHRNLTSFSPTSSAQAQEAEGDAAPQRAPRAERRALLLALEAGEEDDSDSRKPDGETPRWMFWRRRSD